MAQVEQRGIVLETSEKEVVILTDNGEFKKIPLPKKIPRIGDEITLEVQQPLSRSLKPKKSFRSSPYPWLGVAVAVFFVFLLSFSSLQSYLFPGTEGKDSSLEKVALLQEELQETERLRPVKYVTVDINPSIELGLDRQNRVIELKALNADGEKIVAHRELEGLSVEEAIQEITREALRQGYLAESKDNQLLIAVYAEEEETEDEQNQLEEILRYSAQQVLAEDNLRTDKIQTIHASKEQRIRSQELGLSIGKFALILEALEQGLESKEQQSTSPEEAPSPEPLKPAKEKVTIADKETTVAEDEVRAVDKEIAVTDDEVDVSDAKANGSNEEVTVVDEEVTEVTATEGKSKTAKEEEGLDQEQGLTKSEDVNASRNLEKLDESVPSS
ncbi:anti-sigma factor domain-containing protein [Heliorestis acidaminivorans]|uniref:Anti-sigma factor domain-containing protein n=1 Tax=Heliorestis acidaminivorans TaxID=553427 RepID=A0A6I0EZQ3_9FIRM|nr:anti-sigma factor domain-containing protein [Heliorestis acidaminivorans]